LASFPKMSKHVASKAVIRSVVWRPLPKKPPAPRISA